MTPKISPVLWALITVLQLGRAQIDYNPETNTLSCSKIRGHYCLEESLQGSTMLSCVSETVVEIRSCDIKLSRIISGYDNIATCYESSGSVGDALCAFNGTGYTLDGTHVDMPETTICDGFAPPKPRLLFKDESEDNTTTPHILTRGASLETETFPALTERRPSSTSIKAEVSICSNPWPECATCLSCIISTEETTTTPAPSPSPTSSPTLTDLPTDASGRPYSVVSEIVNVAADTKPEQETSSPSKGVVLVEPCEPVTATAGGDEVSMGTAVVAFDVSRLVVVLMGRFAFWWFEIGLEIITARVLSSPM